MAKLLTNQRDVPFELGFKYPLEKGYTFKEMSMRDIKDFQGFLDKVSNMTVQQVDKLYARKDIIKLYGLIQIIRYIIKIFRVCFKDFSIKHALIFVFKFAFTSKKYLL